MTTASSGCTWPSASPTGATLARARTSKGPGRLTPTRPDAPDAARQLMHGIFVGEIQALEGAGRTCWDFPVGKVDRGSARRRPVRAQARHGPPVLGRGPPLRDLGASSPTGWAPSIGEFSESPFLYEAACNPDPVLRLTGVNRALEGLAIDVFNTMREFGDAAGDPVLEFCEDWMLADEVTHVKMGSDWLRRLTATDKERQERALEFQRIVDKLFSLGGFRGEEDDSPVRLARRFRELAGFDTYEMDELAEIAKEAREEAERLQAAAREKKLEAAAT